MKILHIFTDDKFANFGINQFNRIKDVDIKNHYVVISNNVDVLLRINANEGFTSKKFIKKLLLRGYCEYDVVIFHSFGNLFKLFSKLLPNKIMRVWIGWGFDYYYLLNDVTVLDYKEKRKKYKIDLFELLYKFLNIDKEISKVDYFCPVLNSEFVFFKKFFSKDVKFIDWNYGSQEQIISENILPENYKLGGNIYIGNSSSSTSNHFDALKRISHIENEIIIPVNYGDPVYRAWLSRKIKILSNYNNIKLLDKYLNINDFIGVLLTCNVMILNHIRQQGAGNMALGFFLGHTIYMNSKSLLYHEFKNKGFKILDVKNINSGDNVELLSDADIEGNKCLANKYFNINTSKHKTENLINTLKCNI